MNEQDKANLKDTVQQDKNRRTDEIPSDELGRAADRAARGKRGVRTGRDGEEADGSRLR